MTENKIKQVWVTWLNYPNRKPVDLAWSQWQPSFRRRGSEPSQQGAFSRVLRLVSTHCSCVKVSERKPYLFQFYLPFTISCLACNSPWALIFFSTFLCYLIVNSLWSLFPFYTNQTPLLFCSWLNITWSNEPTRKWIQVWLVAPLLFSCTLNLSLSQHSWTVQQWNFAGGQKIQRLLHRAVRNQRHGQQRSVCLFERHSTPPPQVCSHWPPAGRGSLSNVAMRLVSSRHFIEDFNISIFHGSKMLKCIKQTKQASSPKIQL